MASDDTADRAPSDIVREGIQELEPGTVIDDRVILSRRQAIALATGTLSLGALAGFGSEKASAQAAGQVGEDGSPIDVKANTITFPNLSDDYEIQKNGTDGSGIINFKT